MISTSVKHSKVEGVYGTPSSDKYWKERMVARSCPCFARPSQHPSHFRANLASGEENLQPLNLLIGQVVKSRCDCWPQWQASVNKNYYCKTVDGTVMLVASRQCRRVGLLLRRTGRGIRILVGASCKDTQSHRSVHRLPVKASARVSTELFHSLTRSPLRTQLVVADE